MIKRTLFISLFLIFTGCNKPIPNPHESDPIYLDIKNKITILEGKKQKTEGMIKDFESSYAEANPHTEQPKYLRAKIAQAKGIVEKFDQEIRYYKMKLADRELFVKKKYISAFNMGKQWSNKDEVDLYQKSENWSRNIASTRKNTQREKEEPKSPPQASHSEGGSSNSHE